MGLEEFQEGFSEDDYILVHPMKIGNDMGYIIIITTADYSNSIVTWMTLEEFTAASQAE